jgi:hypothetical protein
LLGLVVYHALLFVSVRQSSSLLYIAWSISIFVQLSSIDGRLVLYLAPDHPQLRRAATVVLFPLSVFLSALFCKEFVKLKNYPKLNRVGNILLLVSLLPLLLSYFFDLAVYTKVCAAFAVIVAAYIGLVVPIYEQI